MFGIRKLKEYIDEGFSALNYRLNIQRERLNDLSEIALNDRPIRFKTIKIREPKKNERIVFLINDDIPSYQLEAYNKAFREAWKTKKPILIGGNIKIQFVKNGKTKIKKRR